jgi:hypothetical protein
MAKENDLKKKNILNLMLIFFLDYIECMCSPYLCPSLPTNPTHLVAATVMREALPSSALKLCHRYFPALG